LEFDARSGGGVADWRQKLDAQRGYVIATEFRNNACKVTRWIAQVL
jgi:translation initiation factor 3 subunit D